MNERALDNLATQSKEDEISARCVAIEWDAPLPRKGAIPIYAYLRYRERPAYQMMKRIVDLSLALIALAIFGIPMLIIATLVKLGSPGPALYWSYRVGRGNRLFRMPKFRTMRIDTPETATCDLCEPEQYVTRVGGFLRQTSLDELPQIWSILIGEMSVVGPRPVIRSETDLITLRTQNQIHRLVPGLTGWAQIHGRDHVDVSQKVELDRHYLENRSILMDLKIIGQTFFKVLTREGIRH
jgi:O-antigen biosynthesis protein WbqP